MGELLQLLTPLHTRTQRDFAARMADDKVHCSTVARQYGHDYWDGDRRYGYGGYHYDGRWAPVAQQLIDRYGLTSDSRILDVGCGKGFLLYELSKLLPRAKLTGIDISQYAIENSKQEIRNSLILHQAQAPYPWPDLHFDLVISLMTLHNLMLPDLYQALHEIERVGKRKFVAVESCRTLEELYNLQCWALTCESFLRPEEWLWLFGQSGYTGDYEFLFF